MSTEPAEDVGVEPDDTKAPADDHAPEDEGKQSEAPEKTEAKARRMGWKPEDEYEGPKDKWVDAETFVKRGEEEAPLQKATIRRLESEVKELRKTLKEFGAHMTKRVQQEYDRAVRDLEERQAQAVEDGDVEGVKGITREIADLTRNMEAGEKPGAGPDTATQEALDAFKAENPWFDTDPVMRGAAIALGEQLQAKHQGKLTAEEEFAEVAKRIRAEFPHKFSNPRRRDAPAVEGAPARNGGKAAKTFNDLPQAAKDQAIKWEKSGLMTRAEYVADYDFTQGAAR